MGERMKSLKGMIKYIGIVLLALLLIMALVIGLMFLMKFEFFGHYFLKLNSGVIYSEVDLNTEEVYGTNSTFRNVQLVVNSNNYGVEVVPIDGSVLKTYATSDYIGFLSTPDLPKGSENWTKDQVLHYISHPDMVRNITTNKETSTVVITLDFTEPSGALAFSKGSKIMVGVPFEIDNRIINYSLDINTGNGDIHLTNSYTDDGKFDKPLVVNSLNLSTNKGDANFVGLGNSKGEKIDSLNLDNFNISTNGGKFDFSNFKTISSNKKIVLDSENATYVFNTLKSYNKSTVDSSYTGGVEVNGKNVKFSAEAVYCGSDGFVYKSETGVLKVKYLYSGIIDEQIETVYKEETKEETQEGQEDKKEDAKEEEKVVLGYKRKLNSATPYENTIFTDSAVVEIYVCVGKLGLFDEYGDVTINYLTHQGSLRTENGNISINHSGILFNEIDEEPAKVYSETSSLILHSTFGNISVNEYYQDAVIYSKKGKINAHSYFNTAKSDRYYYSNISTKDGKITMTSEKNPVKITASDNATIKLVVVDVLDAVVNTKVMNPFEKYMYSAITQNGNIDVILPMKSYLVNVKAKKITGSIGATNTFSETDVQISAYKETQPAIRIEGRNVNLASSV